MASNQLRSSVLSVYKNLLRCGEKFADFNYRMYAKRRIRDSFHENKTLTDSKQIQEKIKFAKDNLKVIERQVIVGNLYKDTTLVIERPDAQKM